MAAGVRVTRLAFEDGGMRLDIDVESNSEATAETQALTAANSATGGQGAGWKVIGHGHWPEAEA